jgi:hypothetical protein
MSDTISGSLRSESPKRKKLVLKDSNVSETDITLDDVKLTLEPLTNSQYNTLLGDLDDEFDNMLSDNNSLKGEMATFWDTDLYKFNNLFSDPLN